MQTFACSFNVIQVQTAVCLTSSCHGVCNRMGTCPIFRQFRIKIAPKIVISLVGRIKQCLDRRLTVEDIDQVTDKFRPELVLISAGFDSRLGDPLGHFRLTDPDFAELTDVLVDIANRHAGGRLVSVLEGGYNIAGLASASAAHCRRLVHASDKTAR